MNLRIIKGLRGRIYSSEIFARRQHPAVCSDVIRLSDENMFDVIKSPSQRRGFTQWRCPSVRLFVCRIVCSFVSRL